MKKLSLVALTLFIACTPDIPRTSPPPEPVVVRFDPGAAVPVVPKPNDLAKDLASGKLTVPTLPTDSAAQAEFNRDYLRQLDGFPYESTAEVLVSGELLATSVTNQTVLAFDIAAGFSPVVVEASYLASTKSISIQPPAGGWTRGHRYLGVVIGGSQGIQGANGETVVGSETWTLVSNAAPLVTCSSPLKCQLAVDVIPSSETDPARRQEDQIAKAKQLELLRASYAPLIDAIVATGVNRTDIALAWTFTIVDAGEVTFDPARQIIPFPNDLVRSNGRVSLPNPKTGRMLTADDCSTAADLQIQLTCGLNTLDGFSTIAPPISENSDLLGAVMQARIDPVSLTADSVGLVALRSDAPLPEQTQPRYTPCLDCMSSAAAAPNGPILPQQLQWKLDAPLDERTTYVAYVTTAVKDDRGIPIAPNPVFALLRSTAPLFDNAQATVDVLTNDQAAQLEPLRVAMQPMFQALEALGIERANLALAFTFTTQTEAAALDQLHALPAALGYSNQLSFVVDGTEAVSAAATTSGIPIDGIGKFYVGAFLSPLAVTGPGGTLDPTHARPQRVDFTLAVPKGAQPTGGYPVTIFGHGFTRSRDDVLAIANSLAKAGQATIAMDGLFHGERSSCTGSKAATGESTDDAACANPITQQCDEEPILGSCVARDASSRNPCTPGPGGDALCAAAGQGRCISDPANALTGRCQNGDFLRAAPGASPTISGWNVFNLSNFFATRDNLRQAVIDLAQLVRVIKGQRGAFGEVGPTLDPSRLGYAGQSLGAIVGTLFNAVSPDTMNVVLNVPGGALSQVILTAPSFAKQKLLLIEALSAQGIQVGTPAFDQSVAALQWILDPADPANLGFRLMHPVEVAPGLLAPTVDRKALMQFIEGDQTVPNSSSLALLAAANRSFVAKSPSFGCLAPLVCYEFTEVGDGFDATTALPTSRHGFLLQPPSGAMGAALTSKSQMQVATFLSTGALP